jgi:hypothetical protein
MQIFVVDNGATMFEHWPILVFVAETLLKRAARLDKSGVDLIFTVAGHHHNKSGLKGEQGEQQFREALDAAEPDNSNSREHQTDLHQTLESIIKKWNAERRPETTVLILTDGAWHGTLQNTVDDTILNLAQEISTNKKHVGKRPFGLQFIRFGEAHHEKLWRLDDELCKKRNLRYVSRIPSVQMLRLNLATVILLTTALGARQSRKCSKAASKGNTTSTIPTSSRSLIPTTHLSIFSVVSTTALPPSTRRHILRFLLLHPLTLGPHARQAQLPHHDGELPHLLKDVAASGRKALNRTQDISCRCKPICISGHGVSVFRLSGSWYWSLVFQSEYVCTLLLGASRAQSRYPWDSFRIRFGAFPSCQKS